MLATLFSPFTKRNQVHFLQLFICYESVPLGAMAQILQRQFSELCSSLKVSSWQLDLLYFAHTTT